MARPDLGEGGQLRPAVDLLVEQIECELKPTNPLETNEILTPAVKIVACLVKVMNWVIAVPQARLPDTGCEARSDGAQPLCRIPSTVARVDYSASSTVRVNITCVHASVWGGDPTLPASGLQGRSTAYVPCKHQPEDWQTRLVSSCFASVYRLCDEPLLH